MPVLRDYLAQFVALSAALVIGIALYGTRFLETEAERFVSTALAFLVVILVYTMVLSCVWIITGGVHLGRFGNVIELSRSILGSICAPAYYYPLMKPSA
jgi:hypothetical protein